MYTRSGNLLCANYGPACVAFFRFFFMFIFLPSLQPWCLGRLWTFWWFYSTILQQFLAICYGTAILPLSEPLAICTTSYYRSSETWNFKNNGNDQTGHSITLLQLLHTARWKVNYCVWDGIWARNLSMDVPDSAKVHTIRIKRRRTDPPLKTIVVQSAGKNSKCDADGKPKFKRWILHLRERNCGIAKFWT